jgi:UPF0716 protein FxsA
MRGTARLALLFVCVPPLELFVLLWLGSALGPTTSFLVILLTGIVGAWLAKREGVGVLRQLQKDLQEGLPSGSRVMEGAMVVVGGLLLVTPGVFTDALGFSLIVPWTRRFMAPRVLGYIMAQLGDSIVIGGTRAGRPTPDGSDPATPFSNPFDDLP